MNGPQMCRTCERTVEWAFFNWATRQCVRCARHERKLHSADELPDSFRYAAVPLEDIDNLAAYVTTYVDIRMPHVDDREEVIGEALAIMFHLHRNAWDRSKCASFKAYASTLLWQRLIDWYRRDGRQSCRVRRVDGEYVHTPVASLDALVEAGREPSTEAA